MTKSIVQLDALDNKQCYLCNKQNILEKHHIMPGIANRRLSEQYGLWVWLCPDCHRGDKGAQYDIARSRSLKQEAQRAFEKIYGHHFWMETFRKNYLDTEDWIFKGE